MRYRHAGRLMALVSVAALVSGCGGASNPLGASAPSGSDVSASSAGASPAAATPAATKAASPSVVASMPPDPTWRLSTVGPAAAIEGWVDRVAGLAGEPVGLHVSTTGSSWTVTAFRMGWYGGVMAARVWQSNSQPGVRQAAATRTPTVNTVQTAWPTSLQLPTATWEPGAYLLRLDAAAGQRYVPFTVRSASTAGKVVLIEPVTTWQAYNEWGGYSSYHGPGGTADFDNRSRAVSFDRPYASDGAADFISSELPVIAHAERLGLNLAYATDIDLDQRHDLLTDARAVVSMGHDEYWSTAMRATVTAARDRGTNVAFLGANAVFRHVRFNPTPTGPDRLMICYKRTSDPLYGVDNSQVTVDWREPPLSTPESSLTGAYYESNPVDADMIITDPSNWLFDGTGATAGQRLPHVVAFEYDRVNPGAPTPHDIEVLTHSPLTCRGVHSYADSAYYTVASGAGVYDSGTLGFAAALPEAGATGLTAHVIGGELTNLLTAFAAGPAGPGHPANRNIDPLHEYPGDAIQDHHNSW
jgi:hypothetical protein